MILDITAAVLAAVTAYVLYSKATARPPPAAFPPGPKGDFFNSSSSPSRKSFGFPAKVPLVIIYPTPGETNKGRLYFDKLFKEFGPIVRLNLAGQNVVILGSLDAVKEVLEKNAASNAGRPGTTLADMTMKGRRTSMNTDNAAWRAGRRMMANLMVNVRNGSMAHAQENEIKVTMRNLVASPGNWYEQFDRFSSSVIFCSLYGMHLQRTDHPIINHIRRVIGYIVILFNPAASIVNMLPFLEKLPLPDSLKPWRKVAQEYGQDEESLHNKMAQDAIARGENGVDSWIWQMHNSPDRASVEKTTITIPYIGGDLFVAGAETSFTFMQNYLLAAMLYPDFVIKARAEVDKVVGSERLPVTSDRSELAIVDAIARELLRWRPPVPQGLAHLSTADIVATIEGQQYFIPKNSYIFGSSWSIDHNPKTYEKPEEFNPWRHLDANGKLLPDQGTAFGFGRRVCVGQPFAERTGYLFVANMLWLFDIARDAKDTSELWPIKESGEITAVPEAFKCVLTPRSAHHAAVATRDSEDAAAELDQIKI